ncbi:rhodanese-like domain-containing protein [Pirellulaceae bacterium SH449]
MSQTITATELNKLIANGEKLQVIDVRTPVEFREVHINIAKNVPLDRLNPQEVMASRNGASSQPLYIVCRSGARGGQACQKFLEAGYSNVVNVEGGTMACIREGMAVTRGKKGIPLQGQVQIIAGTLVMSGVLLAIFLSNQYWLLLSLAVGAGLTFSGLTNTCAMGVLLARMPWNQVAEPDKQVDAPANQVPQPPTCCS